MILLPHDPSWSAEFTALRDVYVAALVGLVQRVEHVGSTAVPGLDAKPILDIDLVIQDYDVFPKVVAALSELGYAHNGDQGIRHREAFKRTHASVPEVSPARQWMEHHLYVCPAESDELRRHVAFRDALNASVELRQNYEELKRDIASRSRGDRKTYARIKERECGNFIERVLSNVRIQSPDPIALTGVHVL